MEAVTVSAVPALAAPGSRASSPPSASPRSEGLPRTAAAIAVTAWGIVVLALVTLVTARPPLSVDLWFFAVDAMVGCVYGLVAGVVLSRRRHVVPAVLALTALGGAVTAFAFAYGSLGQRYAGLPWAEQVLRLNGIAWVPGTLGLFLVVPWLVRGHRLGWGARAGLALGVAVTVAFTVASALDFPVPIAPLAASTVAVGLITAADAAWRWARGPLDDRVGLGWLAIGTTIMALSFVPLAVPAAERLPIWSVPALHLLAQAFFPAAVLVAVLRQRMWGIDLSISRAVLGGVLTAVLVGVYVIVAAGIAHLLPGQGAGQVAGAAAVAVAVQPSRLWLQRRVHRLVHGEASDPQRAVRRLGAHLGTAQSTDELLDGLVASVAEALRLESVELVTADGVAA
ncbi:MAG: sensor histidine kinase, partial [Angustibacter sp.]